MELEGGPFSQRRFGRKTETVRQDFQYLDLIIGKPLPGSQVLIVTRNAGPHHANGKSIASHHFLLRFFFASWHSDAADSIIPNAARQVLVFPSGFTKMGSRKAISKWTFRVGLATLKLIARLRQSRLTFAHEQGLYRWWCCAEFKVSLMK